MHKVLAIIGLVILGGSTLFGQNPGNQAAADRTLRGSGRVNASTLAMEFDLPLASFPGRGINVPISLSYSSKVWRMRYLGNSPVPGSNHSPCSPEYIPEFGEKTASGWTTSLAVPFIEYIGMRNLYRSDGSADADVGDCPTTGGGDFYPRFYIRRILVHLPSGETHELRAGDGTISFTPGESDLSQPENPIMWNAVYYAADSSNLKYIQDSQNGIYRLQMPDGSFYDFNPATQHGADRPATRYTDRNGNYTEFHGPTAAYPNGYWIDTLGRVLAVPLGLSAPVEPTPAGQPIEYSVPGMTGKYRFHWKRLKVDGQPSESALYDIQIPLKYLGTTYNCQNSQGFPTYCTYPLSSVLFAGNDTARVKSGGSNRFNPVLLTEIETPTGQSYRFRYDEYGRIVKIMYPTGGEETFDYAVIPSLSSLEPDDISEQSNFGVIRRKVFESAGDPTPYIWNYEAAYIPSEGYRVQVNSPDGTSVKRYLYGGPNYSAALFGFDSPLAGMPFREDSFDNVGRLISQKITSWSVSGAWHPRVISEETRIYDKIGNGISATSKYEYAGDLSQFSTPVLRSAVADYPFVAAGDPLPERPLRTAESVFLIYDSNYSSTAANYIAQNIVGLVTASVIKDGNGHIVARSETIYDEAGRSPGYRGNPTSARIWDSTKGSSESSNAYITTHARFDQWGNQYESTDAKGNTTTTVYDSTHNAFPVQVISPVPDPSGQKGSNQPFISTTTFDYTTGLPLTTTDANGLETRIEYDPVSLRPVRSTTWSGGVQVGSTTETVYHDEPNNYWVKNRSRIDENNWAENITYFDGLGRAWRSEEINSKGNIFIEKEFDAEGRVKRVTNPFRENEVKQWTTNVYDEASRIIEVIFPDGAKVKTDYAINTNAPLGITKQITDQAGRRRKGITDALGRMIRVIEDPAGQNLVTDYVFDTLGNLRKTIQGEQSRYFMHDSLGRLLYARQVEQDPNTAFVATDPVTGNSQWTVKYEYDDNGNITKTTDARNVSVQGIYDNLNRIIFRDYSDATPDVSFYYDGTGLGAVPSYSKGKLTRITNSISETRYTAFDNLGRLLAHQQVTDGQTYSTAYTYNLSGALIEERYPSGRVVKNVLDGDGDLAMIQSRKSPAAGYIRYASNIAYNSFGAVEKMRLGNGRWETAVYNNRLQVTQIGLGETDSTQNLLKLEFSYGDATQNNGSMREQKVTVPAAGTSQGFIAIQSYEYDELNRIRSATETIGGSQTWKQTFVYDRYGNRRFDEPNTTTLPKECNGNTEVCEAVRPIFNPAINAANNRLSSAGLQYDAAGNLTVDGEGRQMLYDAEDHLKEVRDSQSSVVGQYFYDGEGRRVKKISSTETTVFVYNAGGRLVAEYSTVLAETQQVSYLTTDHLGSPRVVTNGSGAVVSRKDFAAFGDEVATPQRTQGLGYQPTGLRQDYTGYEKDDESGLEFAQARYYNPTHGRFTSVDPLTASATIRNPQTFNRYTYALNSPYKFTDPLGLIPSSTGACGGWCQNYASDRWGGSAEFDSLAGAPPIWPFIYEVTEVVTTLVGLEGGKALRIRQTAVWYENSYGAYLGSKQDETDTSPNKGMSMSKDGRAMLSSEGMEWRTNEPYDKDGSSRGNCTVGVGHLLNTGPCNAANKRVYSDAEIDQFLDADLRKAESIVINTVRVPLNQYEFDALVMLAFNYPRFGSGGAPRLVQALNAGRGSEFGSRGNAAWGRIYWIREATIRKEWADINKSNGKIVRGLTSRRSREIRLFFDAEYSQ